MRNGHLSHQLRICTTLVAALFVVALGPHPAIAHGEAEAQIARLSELIYQEPDNAVLHWQRGELQRVRGRWQAALTDFERAAQLDPHKFSADFGRALIDLDRGFPQRALEALERHLAANPNSVNARFVRVRALHEAGRLDEAIVASQGAVAADPNASADAWLLRARLFAARADEGDIERAIATLDRGLERLGPVVTLQLYAVDLEISRCRYGEAIRRLDSLEPYYGRRESLLVRRGEILERAGRHFEALVSYTEALDALRQLPDAQRATASTESLDRQARAALARLASMTGGRP